MADILIIVPKKDEFEGIIEQLKLKGPLDTTKPNYNLSIRAASLSAKIWNTEYSCSDGSILFLSIALLNHQTNTFSAVLTNGLIMKERPSIVILAGTCMGRKNKVDICDIIVPNEVTDITEERGEKFVPKDLGTSEKTLNILEAFNKSSGSGIMVEGLVSGNRFVTNENEQTNLWDSKSTAKVYDMEASGFVLSAFSRNVPWLIMRTVSDYGTAETTEYRKPCRKEAILKLGSILNNFLVECGSDLKNVVEESTRNIQQQRLNLKGKWKGYMGYLDDNGEDKLLYKDSVMLDEFDGTFNGTVNSVVAQENREKSERSNLKYAVSFQMSNNLFAAGVWSSNENSFVGTVLGKCCVENNKMFLNGFWLGTHSTGIKKGVFSWQKGASKYTNLTKSNVRDTLNEESKGR